LTKYAFGRTHKESVVRECVCRTDRRRPNVKASNVAYSDIPNSLIDTKIVGTHGNTAFLDQNRSLTCCLTVV